MSWIQLYILGALTYATIEYLYEQGIRKKIWTRDKTYMLMQLTLLWPFAVLLRIYLILFK